MPRALLRAGIEELRFACEQILRARVKERYADGMEPSDQLRGDLLRLIADYQRRVATFVKAAQAKYGKDDLLAAWLAGDTPQDGMLDDQKGTRFTFHGVGCCVTSVDAEVDFDFGPEGRCDGFDGWRLWTLAESRPQEYPQFQRPEIVESVLGELVTEGIVIRPHRMPSPHLCYLNLKERR